MISVELQKYSGSKSRHVCPSCSHGKVFSRYVRRETGEEIAPDVGRCNREAKCGYHYTPKQYFADNPAARQPDRPGFVNRAPRARAESRPARLDRIESRHLLETLTDYESNSFVQFLLALFPDCHETVWKTIQRYWIGTKNGFTVFPKISRDRRICNAKLMKFDASTGKRIKSDFSISSLPFELRREGVLKHDFEADKTVFFGEHLTAGGDRGTLAVVEAEKTAIIASMVYPDLVWIATGSKQFLKAEKLQKFAGRRIILYPDGDGFDEWRKIAREANCCGLSVKVSNIIEAFATDEQKRDGYDLADCLVNHQTQINRYNSYADEYNAALAMILRERDLLDAFETILDEQKAILIINGGLSEDEAERRVCDPVNLRGAVMSAAGSTAF